MNNHEGIKKIVLAYSGGLDTSIIIPWLKENYNNPEIIAVSGDVGQNDELEGLEEKAIKTGASKLYIADLTDEMVDEVIIPSMMMGAKYEDYLLGTAFARPIIAKRLVEIAKAEGADIMLWSIDSMDWSKRASIENMKTLISGQKLRGVFLFHDTHEQTIEALPEILDRLIADGCQFVTVSEYLAALRQDALPEGVKVAAPVIQGNPHQPAPPQNAQAEREAPQQLFQPGDVHEVRQPMAPRPKAAETPGAEQMAGHSTNMNDAEPAALRTSML